LASAIRGYFTSKNYFSNLFFEKNVAAALIFEDG